MRLPSREGSHALCICQTFDVFFKVRPKTSRIPKGRYRRRVNPTFTMSFRSPHAAQTGGAQATNLIIPRSRYQPLRMRGWWSQTDSNRRHPACKAGALPTELWPLTNGELLCPGEPGRLRPLFRGGGVVGPTRFELVTSRLSSVRSNQLSYGPIGRIDQTSSRRTKPVPGLAIASIT